MARYGQAFNEQSGSEVAAAGEPGTGCSGAAGWQRIGNLGALARGCTARPPRGQVWAAGARFEEVIITGAMNEAAESAWCREHGAYPAELDKWRASCTTALVNLEDVEASPQVTRADRKRIMVLDRDLLRKDRAVAETAALLVPPRKVAAIFSRGDDE